ncbi:hypothetical protein Curi_c27470 [Gottschalkia acidurici 9a]|uniref:Uncharacterized protein n=1 Tax=Gottschalkia acidurici (strain ATCC 7906 / DSM 604 / BCRC 14475 / CIP 104303 / KCTC 5404 / NCIMB 10678 / 9a) TaxID=1128398 RepID=K0B469_GOTA9|nr:ABC transporter permease [Gottschalkia acidurici]AFS79740.1 hypothetical protein Curi_c27470 [Gottschalkia acidurici 9a]
MIQMLKIEFLKTKNTRSFVIPFLLFLIGSLWAIAASQLQTINPSDMETLPKIVALFASLNGLFFSIAIGLFTSKISSIEHIGNTFKLLFNLKSKSKGVIYIKNIII